MGWLILLFELMQDGVSVLAGNSLHHWAMCCVYSKCQGLGKKLIFLQQLLLVLGVQEIEQIVRETCMNMISDRTIGILHHVACFVLPRFSLLKLLVSPHI